MKETPEINPNTSVIFLDIDGVMNSGKWIDENPGKEITELIDPSAVEKLNKIVDVTGAKIVISSSWRIQFIDAPNGFQRMVEFFAKFGITNIVGMTPRFRGKPRSEEIVAWLKEHPVASFVILDDDFSANVLGRQIKTLFEDGLQNTDVTEAVRILGRKL